MSPTHKNIARLYLLKLFQNKEVIDRLGEERAEKLLTVNERLEIFRLCRTNIAFEQEPDSQISSVIIQALRSIDESHNIYLADAPLSVRR